MSHSDGFTTPRVVLCIDDNDANRYIRAHALRAAGFAVVEGADGRSALKLAVEEQPALIVLDVRLPDVNGFEVCDQLKSDPRTRSIPILHVTAVGRLEEDIPEALTHRSDAYLHEPIEPETLVATARALIRARDAERCQRAAEERARAAERYAAHLLESLADPVVAFDRQWRYTFVSRRAAEAFGGLAEEMVGESVWRFWPGGADSEIQSACERAWAEACPVTIERHSEADDRWTDTRVYPFEDGAIVQLLDVTERKRAVQSAIESEKQQRRQREFLKSLLDNIPSCVAVMEGRELRFTLVNPAFQATAGPDAPIVGRTYREVFAQAPAAEGELLRVMETGERWAVRRLPAAVPQRPEAVWEGEVVRLPPVAGEKPSLLAMVSDVTDRAAAEEQLRHSEERFRNLLESAMEGVWLVGADGRIEYANQRMAEMLKCASPQELLGREVFDFLPAEDRGRLRKQFAENLAGGRRYRGEARLSCRDGDEIWAVVSASNVVDEQDRPVGRLALFADVTQQKLAERAAEQQREWLRVTLGSIGDAVLATDADGRIAFLNGVAAALTGWTEEEAVGRSATEVFRIINERTREAGPDVVAQVLRENRVTPLANQTALIARDGREIPIEDSAAPIRDRQGKLLGVVLVFRDVAERRRADAALRESEGQFRTLANAIPQLCWMANADGWIFWYNQRWYEYTGTTPQQMEGWGWQSVHDPAELPGVLERWNASIATGQPFDMVFPLRGADGFFRPFLTRIVPLFDAEGRVARWFGTNTDVSEQRRHEQALRESEERLRAFVTASSDSVYRMSADWSEMRALVGQEFMANSDTPDGDWLERYIPPEDHGDVLAAIDKAVRTKGVFELEHRVVRADGSIGWTFSRAVPVWNAQGEIVEWFGAASDITARKEAEAALRESEARERARAGELEAILDAAPVALFIAQDPECRHMLGSRTTYEMLGVPRGANVSKSAPEAGKPGSFRTQQDRREIPLAELPVQRAAATGKAVRNYEFDLVYPDGGVRNLLGDAVPLFDDQGRTRGAVGAFIDISERKRQEERLRQAQKLESIGLLAGGIAHDFNNLLTGIMGNASLALDEAAPEPAERIREVMAAAERAAHLTRQLLAYSGQGQFIVRDLNVAQAVREIGDLVQFSIPKSVTLSISAETRLPLVHMDPSQLQQVLMNLVINAGEAIGEGNPGRISVATSMRDVDEEFLDATGGHVRPGRYVSIEVSDTGGGIEEDTMARIFDPFFTTKFTGRGLGLAAVAGIVRSQKGGITVDSVPGAGSTFRVFLPAAGRSAKAELPAGEAARGAILVIDDERYVREFIAAVLRRQGYRVLTADDGREALAICERTAEPIVAAILDVVMPELGARELLPAMNAMRPEMRILLTSGYSESEARRLCQSYPTAAFIQKPYTAQQLTAAVEALTRRGGDGDRGGAIRPS